MASERDRAVHGGIGDDARTSRARRDTQQILELLRRHGQMTAAELSEALGIGAVGVRQHIALLERDGLVHTTAVRRGVGRPSHLYALTPAAEALFPKRYDRMAMDALAFIEEQGGQRRSINYSQSAGAN